ncbi:prepilin-type N-terminal cleavage/methylation domain-containing protein [Massilia sp. CF038]|uniref:type IV pilus modification PilV family protein n=1 Tax=Massilia sp. CF038 TaxID=1881045 RepID=UPI00091B9420|nr:type II secretion system protein [Massilia sp. CF038]SHG64429.1 MSHA pilin protein MshD [Massilia sp. CF038]
MCASTTQRRRAGFTLIEMIVFIVIVAIALAAVLRTLSITAGASADPIAPKQAMLVAESMLEEILLKPFSNPEGGYAAVCPGTCDRARFDNVGDYAGYTSNGVFALDDLATPVAGLGGYNVAVSVTSTNVTAKGNGAPCLRVTVSVSAAGTTYQLHGYRFNDD